MLFFDSFVVFSAVILALFMAKTLLSRVVCGELITVYGALLVVSSVDKSGTLGGLFYLIPFAVQITVAVLSLSVIPRCRPAEFIYMFQAFINLSSAILYSHKITLLYDNYVPIMGFFDVAKLAVICWYWRVAFCNRDLPYHRGCLPWQTK